MRKGIGGQFGRQEGARRDGLTMYPEFSRHTELFDLDHSGLKCDFLPWPQ